MKANTCKFLTGMVATTLLVVAQSAQAALVMINNAGFEAPTTANDTWGGNPSGWVASGAYPQVLRPVVNTPNANEGSQVVGMQINQWIYQDLLTTFDLTKTYTLTVYGATPSFAGGTRSGIQISLRNANTNAVLAEANEWLNGPGGAWKPVSVTRDGATLGANAGAPIRIFISKPNWSNGSNSLWTVADNVTLNAIPEPSTWSLLAGGMTAFALYRRRRQG